jgi:hypothetical protein
MPGLAADADASVLHAPAHDVTLGSRRGNRRIAEGNVAAAGKARSSPDAGMADQKNLSKNLPSAGPRASRPAPASPLRRPGAPAVALDTAGSAHADVLAPLASRDTAAPHATAASRAPRPDIVCCNSDDADGWKKRDARTPSANSSGTTGDEAFERNRLRLHTEAGPREVMLPQVKSRSGVGRSASRRFFFRLGALQLTRCHTCVQKFSGAHSPRLGRRAIRSRRLHHARAPLGRHSEIAVSLRRRRENGALPHRY